MAMRDILDRQANSIEYVLHTHGINARIDGGRLSPRLSHFHIVLPPGVRPTQLSPLIAEMSEALGVTSSHRAPDPAGEGVFLGVPLLDQIPFRRLSLFWRWPSV